MLSFQVTGAQALQAKFRSIEIRGRDLSEVWPQIADVIGLDMATQFEMEGDPKWKPLAPRTIAQRLRLGFGAGPILYRTGSLREAWSTETGQTREITPTSLYIGPEKVSYAKYHQSRLPRTRIPRRPLRLRQSVVVEALRRIRNWIMYGSTTGRI